MALPDKYKLYSRVIDGLLANPRTRILRLQGADEMQKPFTIWTLLVFCANPLCAEDLNIYVKLGGSPYSDEVDGQSQDQPLASLRDACQSISERFTAIRENRYVNIHPGEFQGSRRTEKIRCQMGRQSNESRIPHYH